jgi:flagellin
MQGHDAGLKGTLVDQAKKATFTLSAKAITVGATINIGGKNYVIGTMAATAEAQATYLKGKLVTGLTVKIDNKNYSLVSDYGDYAGKQTLANAAGVYTVSDAKKSLISAYSTVVVNGVTYKGISSITNGSTKMGIDDSNTTIISIGRAVKLITAALKAANLIGVDKTESVKVSINTKNYTAAAMDSSKTISFTIDKGYAETNEALNFALHVGADADMTNKIAVGINTMNAKGLGIRGLNVLDNTGAAGTYAIDSISDALQKVSDQRAALGAVQNRLEHTIKNLDNVVENTTSAESTIRDTDMASEMVKYSNNNILQQAGQSMLAQANQSNQGVLSLLG